MKKRNLLANDLLYWVTLLSACTMGETEGDFISFGLKLGYGWGTSLLAILLLIALIAEARAKVPNEFRYWTTIVIMSTTGTTLADLLTRTLKLGYGWGSVTMVTLFALVFLIRHRLAPASSKQTFHAKESVLPHIDISTSKRSLPATDVWYWGAIMVASTMGTTLGDFVSNVLNLGFGGGALVLGGLLTVVLILEFRAKVPNEARYWTALVLTSTIGATTGDFLTKEDGLNLGYGWGSAILVVLFVIIFLIRRQLAPASPLQISHTKESVLPHVDIQ